MKDDEKSGRKKEHIKLNIKAGMWRIGLTVTAFVFVVLISCFVFLGKIIKDNKNTVISELKEYTNTTQVALQRQINDDFGKLNGIAACISEIEEIDDEKVSATIKRVNVMNSFIRMGFASPDGKAQMHDINGEVYSVDFSDEDFFKKALSGENSIQDTVKDPFSDGWIVRYAVPVEKRGKTIGVLVANHSSTVFSSVVDLNEWSGYGYANIISGDGQFIIRTNSKLVSDKAVTLFDLIENTDGDKKAYEEALNSDDGIFKYTSNEGKKVISVIKPIGFGDWQLICSLSEEYVNAQYFNNVAPVIVVVLTSLAMMVIIVVLTLRTVRRGQQYIKSENEEKTAVIEQSGNYLLRYDTVTHTLYCLSEKSKSFGLPEIVENYPESIIENGIIMPVSQADYLKFFQDMRDGIPEGAVNVQLRRLDGTTCWHHSSYKLLPGKDGKLTRSIISFYDNTEQREKEIAYEMRHRELKTLRENCSFYLEANLMTGQVEMTHGEAVNINTSDIEKMNFHTLVDWDASNNVYSDDAYSFREFFEKNRLISLYTCGVFTDSLEFRAILNGELTWNKVSIQMGKEPYCDDIKIYVVFTDVTEEHNSARYLLGKSTDDALTGLLSRETTMVSIEKYLTGIGVAGTHTLFMIDIDDFKQINDTLGHQTGDRVLVKIASSIRRCFRKNDIVGRIGGDEFFAFMKNKGDLDTITEKANELLNELQYVYSSGNVHVHLSGSIGITVYHGDDEKRKSLNTLYAEADAALYNAKAKGKNCYSISSELSASECVITTENPRSTISLNLRNLIDNLGGGIEINHGTPDGILKPMFCNESFYDLLGGISEDEFMTIYGENAYAGVHHDDVAELQKLSSEALYSGKQLQHTYRMMGKDGSYYWITETANFIRYADGSHDVYAVFVNADKAVEERKELTDKYRDFKEYRKIKSGNTVASFHLNLTTDKCEDGQSSIPYMLAKQIYGTASGFFNSLCKDIDSDEDAEKFREACSRDALLESFDNGETVVVLDFPCYTRKDKVMWLRVSVEMALNPLTQDVEALAYFFDIDKQTRMQYMMRRLINTDYEFLGQIDIRTGQMIVFGGNTTIELSLSETNSIDYNKDLADALKYMIRDEFYDDAYEALKLERIITELQNVNTYVCSFPTKQCGGMSEGFRQWKCGYIGERKAVIMISRTDVTDTLGGDIDTLTGIYNQQGFVRNARRILSEHPDEKFRIIRFDIDNFKLLNDSLGFARGDQLLRDLGARLRYRINKSNGQIIYARLEADHFVCLRRQGEPSANELICTLGKWLENYPLDFRITAHMGEYLIDDPNIEITVMCDRALMALRSVKHSFSQRLGFYDESFRDKLMEEQELVRDMYSALDSEQFEVYFQPQINYEDNTYFGAEALVRWRHPLRGLISPGVFIPLFEANGFISELDEYIWDKTCGYIRKWLDNPDTYQAVAASVNISRIDIYNRNLVQILKSIVQKHNIPIEMLKLEITESAYMQNPGQLINTVHELRNEGFIIEMDDFGSGYSSLNTLKEVPVDILKLDMKFLSHGDDDERGGNILSSVIRMAHWLKLPVIAEGVETKQQADYLKSLGCLYMQGYYFSRPIPVDQFEKLLIDCKLGTMDKYADVSLDGVAAFWDPSAQSALLFNSFVGGAAILEYRNGKAEIVRANDKFYPELETTQKEYLDKQMDTLSRFDAENRKKFINMLEEAIRTGNEAECEIQSLPFGNSERRFWTHNRVRLLAKNCGSCLFYLATENITERIEMQEQLRVSREALQQSISNIGRVVCDYDITTHVLTLPREYAKKHGFPETVTDIHLKKNKVISADKERYIEFFDKIHQGESNVTVLLRITDEHRPNAYAWEHLDAVTVYDDENKPVRAIITCKDVTLEKEREAENVRNSVIIENTNIIIIDYDVLTDTMHFQSGRRNSGTDVIRGYLKDYVNLENGRVHPDDKQKHKEYFENMIKGEPMSGSYDIRANNWGDGYRWTRLNYICLKDHAGKIYRIVGQISDVQKEKDDEELIHKLGQQLDIGTAGYRFNAMLAERVFTLLFSYDANSDTIDKLLSVIGEYYDLSRVYIFKDDETHTHCSNTYEWCAPGITAEKDNLQNLSYADDFGGIYHTLFNENGVFYCDNINTLPKVAYDILAPQNIKSMLHCLIMDEGVPMGYIGFDECRSKRLWTDEQIGTLLIVARIVGSFLVKQQQRELAYFSEDFKSALDDEASYVYIVEPNSYEIKYCNKAVRDYVGHNCEGNTCYSEFIGRSTPCLECPMNIHRKTGKARSVEVKRSDDMLVLAQASPMRWNGMDMYMITSIDITEQQNLRCALNRNAVSIQTMYDTMPCGILQYTLHNNAKSEITFNKTAVTMTGFTDDEDFFAAVSECKSTMHTHPDDLKRITDEINNVLSNGGMADYEHRVILPNGNVSWVRVQFQRIERDDGSFLIQAMFYDINERRKLLNDIDYKAKSLQMLYDTMPSGILQYLINDGQRELISYNSAAWKILGYEHEKDFTSDMDKVKFFSHVYEEDVQFVREKFKEVMVSDDRIVFEHRVVKIDGTLTTILAVVQRTKGLANEDIIQVVISNVFKE